MTEITKDVIRAKAREIILSHADDFEFLSIGESMEGDPRFEGLSEAEFDAVERRIDDEIEAAKVTATWPDEHGELGKHMAACIVELESARNALRHVVDEQAHRIQSGLDRIAELETERNGAYRERAQLLSLLALNYDAFITEARDVEHDCANCDGRHWHLLFLTIGGWQATWHISPDDMGLWAHVPYVTPDDPRVQWDGHTTPQKYARIADHIEMTCEEAGA